MKKISVLLLLIATVLFFSCEEEQLIQEDLNQISNNELTTQERISEANSTRINSNEYDLYSKKESMETMSVEGNNVNIQEPCATNHLIVYVDYTDVAEELGSLITNSSIEGSSQTLNPNDDSSQNNSSLGQSNNSALQDYINYHELFMSNKFTIHEIIQSENCDYVYKWIVDKCEYYAYCVPCYMNTGGAKAKHVPKDDDSGSFFDIYAQCFMD